MPTFTERFKIKALEDRLPFNLDFEIRQVKSDVTEEVAGYSFPVLNDLTSGESWFFESIESQNSGRISDLTLSLRSLAKKLKEACKLESMKVASEQLFNPSEEVLNSVEYEEFIEANYKEIDRITEASRLAQDSSTMDWLRVTFFMISRIDGSWQLSDSAMLTKSQIESILSFVAKEANKGVIPEPVETEEETEEVEGKPTTDKTGTKSTGN
ncbi:MAG: hypothetical protein ACRC80_25980 [Waterburya sp.]